MAGKKRKAKDIPLLTREQLLKKINNMRTLKSKALASFIYLTGVRVSEALTVRAGQIQTVKEHGDDYLMITSLPISKRRSKEAYRNIPIKMEFDEGFAKLLIGYASNFEDDDKIFNLTRYGVYHILNNQLGIYPHLLRHYRCSHLVRSPYNLREYDLQQFIGWKRAEMASIYVRTSTADITRQWSGK